jgi:SAM-dependent methyltransferase
MLTIDFDRLAIEPGDLLLDLGAGTGRHAFEALRRGARTIALDLSHDDLAHARDWLAAMAEAGEAHPLASALPIRANALQLPFPDATFDHVIVSEVFEHIPDDEDAMREVTRVLKPGGRVAVSVPRYWPERVCWALSGHVRIYKATELKTKLRRAGLMPTKTHHAHALHAPYWWVKCAVGARNDAHPLPRLYHRFLVWDLTARPRATRVLERALNPLLGKSVVVYGSHGR